MNMMVIDDLPDPPPPKTPSVSNCRFVHFLGKTRLIPLVGGGGRTFEQKLNVRRTLLTCAIILLHVPSKHLRFLKASRPLRWDHGKYFSKGRRLLRGWDLVRREEYNRSRSTSSRNEKPRQGCREFWYHSAARCGAQSLLEEQSAGPSVCCVVPF